MEVDSIEMVFSHAGGRQFIKFKIKFSDGKEVEETKEITSHVLRLKFVNDIPEPTAEEINAGTN